MKLDDLWLLRPRHDWNKRFASRRSGCGAAINIAKNSSFSAPVRRVQCWKRAQGTPPTIRGFVVLYEDSTHRSPSIVAENSSTDLKSAIDFASMSVDDLWKYRESIDGVLKAKIAIELAELKRRLDLLNSNPSPTSQKRRSYPPVQPKYCNPEDQSETWAGRGNQPRWVRMQLSLGRRLEDFRIGKPGHQRRIAAA